MEQRTSSTGLQDSTQFISDTFRQALVPAILSMAGVMASTLANSLIAGNLLGDHVLAVLSIANPIYFLFATIGGFDKDNVCVWKLAHKVIVSLRI